MLPHEVLTQVLLADPAAPRVTYYDDTDGPTHGERIELSGKVLDNWVSQAGNLLLEEFDLAPGQVVALDLPAEHWRTLYWALAVWAIGGTVIDDPAAADVVISTRPDAASPADLVLVTLPALARQHEGGVPDGAIDEAREVATYDDVLGVVEEVDADADALRTAAGNWTYDTLLPEVEDPAPRRLVGGDLAAVLRNALAAWAAGGSALLCRGADEQTVADRLRVEGAVDRTR